MNLELNSENSTPETYTVVRQTWLSTRVKASALIWGCLVTLILIAVSVSVFKGYLNHGRDISATAEQVFGAEEYWRAWSTLFVHGDEKHLVSNSFLFLILGSLLNNYFGVLIFPISAFFFAGIANLYVLSGMPPEVQLIGASGIVYWMGGFWLVMYLTLDLRRTRAQRWMRAVGVGMLLFMPAEAFDPGVSYQTHFVGFVLGNLAAAVFYYRHRRTFEDHVVTEIIISQNE